MSEVVQRLRELSGKATPVPWSVDDRGSRIEIGDTVTLVCEIDASYDSEFDRGQCETDAALIAESRNHLDALLNVAEAARHYLDGTDPDGKLHLMQALARLDEPAGGKAE